jgi:hypothetical protein
VARCQDLRVDSDPALRMMLMVVVPAVEEEVGRPGRRSERRCGLLSLRGWVLDLDLLDSGRSYVLVVRGAEWEVEVEQLVFVGRLVLRWEVVVARWRAVVAVQRVEWNSALKVEGRAVVMMVSSLVFVRREVGSEVSCLWVVGAWVLKRGSKGCSVCSLELVVVLL